LKISSAGLTSPERDYYVEDATAKPNEILKILSRLGFIPKKIHFYDDRIENFSGITEQLSRALGIEVIFYKARVGTEKTVSMVPTYV
jgi:hypothetical protein